MSDSFQVFEQRNQQWVAWNSGASSFFPNYLWGPSKLTVAVRCRLGSLSSDEIVLLDTGATWSVIDDELAGLLDADLGEPIEAISLSTRFGVLEGTLSRMTISLLAEPDWGSDLSVDATVAVIPDWPGPIMRIQS